MILRKLKLLLLGPKRHVRPPRACLLGILPVATLLLAAEAWTWERTLDDGDPAKTLLAARGFLDRPPPLQDALDLSWRHAMAGSREVTEKWTQLLSPTLPPPLCPAAAGLLADGGSASSELDAAVRRLAAALRSQDPTTITAALQGLDDTDRSGLRESGAFLLHYNLALGNAARGEYGEALRLLRPVFEDFVAEERVPTASRDSARALVESGEVAPERAMAAFHARALAGFAAYQDNSDPVSALVHYRMAINTVNYLPTSSAAEGHYQRVEVQPGAAECGSGSGVLTSLDAYAGLVAAYLAAPGFTERTRLAGEVARSSAEINASDPLYPLLRYAQQTPSMRTRPEVPEHVLWAASNLQRVYYFNRRHPDSRLEIARAVLLLQLVDSTRWAAAVTRSYPFDRCKALRGVARDLARDEERHGFTRTQPTRPDTVRAVLAIRTYARLGGECGETAVAVVDDSTRSRWVRTAGSQVAGGTAAFAETQRLRVRQGLEIRSAEELEHAFSEIDPVLAALRWGRMPRNFPAGLEPSATRDFLRAWRRSLFAETAARLAEAEGGNAPDGRPLDAAQVPEYVRALNHAAGQAGLVPAEVYGPGLLGELARSQGPLRAPRFHILYTARNHPVGATVVFLLAILITVWIAARLYRGLWRYHLLVGARFYAREAAASTLPPDSD